MNNFAMLRFSLTYESSFFTLGSKGARMHLLGLFGLSLYWHLQTVLQGTIYFERTFRAILNYSLGDAKNLLGTLLYHIAFIEGTVKNLMGFTIGSCLSWRLFY